jgi:hypothetical protein
MNEDALRADLPAPYDAGLAMLKQAVAIRPESL